MSAFILVFAHRYFAVTDDEGRYRLDNVPPGTYTVKVWNETVHGDPPKRSITMPEGGGDVDADFTGPMSALSSLTNRIFFATAFLAVLCIGVAIAIVNVAVTRQAEDELRHGLDEAARWSPATDRSASSTSSNEARLIADLPKLKAAVDTNDPATVYTDRRGLPERAQGRFLHHHAPRPAARRASALPRSPDEALLAMPWIAQRLVRPRGHRVLAGRARHPPGRVGADRHRSARSPATCTSASASTRRPAERFKTLTNSEIAFAARRRSPGGHAARRARGPRSGDAAANVPGITPQMRASTATSTSP